LHIFANIFVRLGIYRRCRCNHNENRCDCHQEQ
jgi:hypothetical protein